MKNKKGFTLIELLVVIAIIGLLSTLAVISLNNAREKSRDARRLSDIRQIQTALELYMNDEESYPAAVVADGDISGPTSGATYMQIVPDDPGTGAYTYTQTGSGASYTIQYTLEGTSGGIVAGSHCATPAGLTDDASGGGC